MKSKSFRMLVASALTAGIVGVSAAPASAAGLHPCHEYDPLQQPVEWTVCMWYYLTK